MSGSRICYVVETCHYKNRNLKIFATRYELSDGFFLFYSGDVLVDSFSKKFVKRVCPELSLQSAMQAESDVKSKFRELFK